MAPLRQEPRRWATVLAATLVALVCLGALLGAEEALPLKVFRQTHDDRRDAPLRLVADGFVLFGQEIRGGGREPEPRKPRQGRHDIVQGYEEED